MEYMFIIKKLNSWLYKISNIWKWFHKSDFSVSIILVILILNAVF